MSKDKFWPAIEALQLDVREHERKAAEAKKMTNRLCELAGIPAIYADTGVGDREVVTAMRADQFYGKVLTTAAREYLEMRAAQNRGPASPREIYQALLEGGFAFDTKIETNAITNIRATLRKNSSTFHRLPNGLYGLLAWYPKAKPAREDGEDESSSAAKNVTRKAAASTSSARGSKKDKAKRPSSAPVTAFVEEAIKDGADWTLDRLKQAAVAQPNSGIDASVSMVAFHRALMGLRNRGLVTLVKKGTWKIVNKTTSPASTDEVVVPIKGAA